MEKLGGRLKGVSQLSPFGNAQQIDLRPSAMHKNLTYALLLCTEI